MNIFQHFVHSLYNTPELKREYKLEKETGIVRIHGIGKSSNFIQGYKDIDRLYPQESIKLKHDLTMALIKVIIIGSSLIAIGLWMIIRVS